MCSHPGPLAAAVRRLALISSLLSAACATAPRAVREQFHRLRSQHFTLYSDLPLEDAREHLRELEALLAALVQYAWEGSTALSVRLNVVLLRDEKDFKQYAYNPTLAGYYKPQVLFEPWIVLPASGARADFSLLNHELTHYLAGELMPYQPRWLSEGLACYFEQARFLRSGEFEIGEVSHHLSDLIAHGLMESDMLFDLSVDPFLPGFYGTAWLLVHYLMSERGDEFARYQSELARGTSHRLAWSRIFPDLQGAVLDQLLRRYLERGQYAFFEFPAIRRSAQLGPATALGRADVEALRAALWATSARSGAQERSRGFIDAALRLDPNQPMALALLAQTSLFGGTPQTRAAARRLTELRPAEWQSWLLLAMVELEGRASAAASEPAIERALALAPEQPFVLLIKAMHDTLAGQREAAIAGSARAVRLAPGNEALWWLRALILAELRACDALAEVTTRLRQIGHARLEPRQQAELTGLEQRCARAPD